MEWGLGGSRLTVSILCFKTNFRGIYAGICCCTNKNSGTSLQRRQIMWFVWEKEMPSLLLFPFSLIKVKISGWGDTKLALSVWLKAYSTVGPFCIIQQTCLLRHVNNRYLALVHEISRFLCASERHRSTIQLHCQQPVKLHERLKGNAAGWGIEWLHRDECPEHRLPTLWAFIPAHYLKC